MSTQDKKPEKGNKKSPPAPVNRERFDRMLKGAMNTPPPKKPKK